MPVSATRYMQGFINIPPDQMHMQTRTPYYQRRIIRERIKRKMVELSRKYSVYVGGKPLYEKYAQQTILAYVSV